MRTWTCHRALRVRAQSILAPVPQRDEAILVSATATAGRIADPHRFRGRIPEVIAMWLSAAICWSPGVRRHFVA